MSDDVQHQLMELQTQFAFQEDLLSALNERVVEQDKELDRLKRMLLALQENYVKLADSLPQSGGEQERPPHY
ncbi:SlyX family protein [Spongiibacter taiwanensis]|uniref:SlyX family protein n=1 Tax=Spongiibacter taiwanensis TaxID=1748242 RepID=UPI002035DB22|nr:SlyX family protein [Spongiibacter taiwanensis]USA42905.1 SlyX family protein [Spongiibacter taiwanensis]